jgi:hypothetical protein
VDQVLSLCASEPHAYDIDGAIQAVLAQPGAADWAARPWAPQREARRRLEPC